jgi:hypothetical protein
MRRQSGKTIPTVSTLLGITTAWVLIGSALSAPCVSTASAAHVLRVHDEGHLRFISSSGAELIDEGPASGTTPGEVRVRFIYNGNPEVSARFTIRDRYGTFSGHARGRLSDPTSFSPSFRGSLSITAGSGRYAHASGSGELFGVFDRRSYGITVQTIATLRYPLPASAASSAPKVHVTASFTPERLGAPTTATVGFQVAVPAGQIPAPLTALDFSYPANLGIATSDLGTAACDPAALEALGAAACPQNSIMGYGSVSVQVPLGSEVVPETAGIVLVAAPSHNGYVHLLVCATGLTPVAARIVMPTLLEGGHLHIDVPLVPSLPDGSYVSVVRAQVMLGGRLTYYELADGAAVAYHPKGVLLPKHCPRGGFRFAGTLSFLDGSRAEAGTTVTCPRR